MNYAGFNKRREEVQSELRQELETWLAAMDAEDRENAIREAEVAPQKLEATITLIQAVACADARGRFARAMCQ